MTPEDPLPSPSHPRTVDTHDVAVREGSGGALTSVLLGVDFEYDSLSRETESGCSEHRRPRRYYGARVDTRPSVSTVGTGDGRLHMCNRTLFETWCPGVVCVRPPKTLPKRRVPLPPWVPPRQGGRECAYCKTLLHYERRQHRGSGWGGLPLLSTRLGPRRYRSTGTFPSGV